MRRAIGLGTALVIVAVGVLTTAGVTDSLGTGALFHTNLGGSFRDGAAADTFWDSPVVDLPGIALTAVHCHGSVRYELQVGATGPSHENTCYAAMGLYDNGGPSEDWGVYAELPGNRAVYRISDNYGPWRYCIATVTYYLSPLQAPSGIPGTPC